jgi:hypothetical protein
MKRRLVLGPQDVKRVADAIDVAPVALTVDLICSRVATLRRSLNRKEDRLLDRMAVVNWTPGRGRKHG